MTIIDETLASELIQQMRNAHTTTIRNKNEFTTAEYATANGIKYDPAAGELAKLEDTGIVTRRKVGQSVFWSFA